MLKSFENSNGVDEEEEEFTVKGEAIVCDKSPSCSAQTSSPSLKKHIKLQKGHSDDALSQLVENSASNKSSERTLKSRLAPDSIKERLGFGGKHPSSAPNLPKMKLYESLSALEKKGKMLSTFYTDGDANVQVSLGFDFVT